MDKFGYKDKLLLDEKLLITIVRISERYKKDCSAIFKNYGLTFTQYNVLRILESSENGQNIISRISDIMLVSGANMTGIAKRLAKDGFLIKKNMAEDERITILEITPKGKRALKNITKDKDELIAKYLMNCSPGQRAELQSNLRKLLSHAIKNRNSL